MNCKFCNGEMGDDHKFCPHCGKTVESEIVEEVVPTEEKTEKKLPMKAWQLAVAITGAVAGLCVLGVLLLTAFGVKIGPRPNDIHKKDSYTVSDAKAKNNGDVVIAEVGDSKLTNGILQIFYADAVYTFVEQNYYYLSSYGLSIDKPLSEQTCFADDDLTWEQYFLDNALESWYRYAVLENMAKAAEFTVEEDLQEYLTKLPEYLQETATDYKYESVEAWLEDNFGPGTTQQDYIQYSTTYYTGSAYLVSRYDELNPTDEEADAYFKENQAAFEENGITKESGKYYDVRHILLEPENGVESEDGLQITYSDADWEACRAKAQELLEKWQSGEATEESFAKLAEENSVDTGSSSNGGLYSQLTKDTSFVDSFKNWYLDASRKKGDTGLVKSEYGYHIMYFSGSQDIWYYTAVQQLLSDRVSKVIEDGKTSHPLTVTYSKIFLAEIEL